MARDWRERDHPRNPHTGEFVEKTGGMSWARRISSAIGRRVRGQEQTHLPPPSHGYDFGEVDPDTEMPIDDNRGAMEGMGSHMPPSVPRAERVTQSVSALRGMKSESDVMDYLDNAGHTRRELDAIGAAFGVDTSGANHDEGKARLIAQHFTSDDILQGLSVVGDPEFPDGYEFDADWAATNRGALASRRYEVFMNGDWDTVQTVIRLPRGVVRIIGFNGGLVLRPGDMGNVRHAEE